MNVCDICKNPSAYNRYVVTQVDGDGKSMDLCPKCYKLLDATEKKYRFLAYQTVVNKVISKPVKKPWIERLGIKKRSDNNESI